MDRLGNVTDIDTPTPVTLATVGALRIVSPDSDGDVTRETILVPSARGVAVVLDDSGGALDDFDLASLIVDVGVLPNRMPVIFPDPDVDDSGTVDDFDVELVRSAEDERLGDPGYDPRLDQSGNGRIRGEDVRIVQNALGQTIPGP